MIKIDTLNLNLPADMAHRSQSIIRHIGEALGRYETERSVRIDQTGPINAQFRDGQSDRSVGRDIARSIAQSAGMRGGDNG